MWLLDVLVHLLAGYGAYSLYHDLRERGYLRKYRG